MSDTRRPMPYSAVSLSRTGRPDALLKDPAQWHVLSAIAQGTRQRRAGIPAQIELDWFPKSRRGTSVALALADYDESTRGGRGKVGAELAAKAALFTMNMFMSQPKGVDWGRLPVSLVAEWTKRVQSYHSMHPFVPKELDIVEGRNGKAVRLAVEGSFYQDYSCSCMAVLVGETGVIYLQIGTGEILAVSEAGGITAVTGELGVMPEKRLTGGPSALHVRFDYFPPESRHFPVLVLLQSKGYVTSLGGGDRQKDALSLFSQVLHEYGVERVSGTMGKWVSQCARRGGGSDVSLGVLCREPHKQK